MSAITSPAIRRELAQPPVTPPALDPSLFRPNEVELQFLKAAISNDEAELRKKVEEVQRM
jgi:hypothetical protein